MQPVQLANVRAAPLIWPDIVTPFAPNITNENSISLVLSSFIASWRGQGEVEYQDKGVQFATTEPEINWLLSPSSMRASQWRFTAMGQMMIYIAAYQPTIIASLPSIYGGRKPLAIPCLHGQNGVGGGTPASPIQFGQSGGTFSQCGYQAVLDHSYDGQFLNAGRFSFDVEYQQATPAAAIAPAASGPTLSFPSKGITQVSHRAALTALVVGTQYEVRLDITFRMLDADGVTVVPMTVTQLSKFVASATSASIDRMIVLPAVTGNVDVVVVNQGLNAFTCELRAQVFASPPLQGLKWLYRRDLFSMERSHCLKYPTLLNQYGKLIAAAPWLNEMQLSANHAEKFGCGDCEPCAPSPDSKPKC